MTAARNVTETGTRSTETKQDHGFNLHLEHLSVDHVVIHLHGTISRQGAKQLARTLNLVMAAEKDVITVDLSDSRLGDGGSIAVLRSAHHAQHTSGRRMHILGAKGSLLTQLMLTGIL